MTLFQSDLDILPGKIPYIPKWPLNIHIRPVLIKNFEICNISEALSYSELSNYKDIWVNIAYNDTVVLKEKLRVSTTHTLYILDEEPTTHRLSLSIHGKTDDHSLLTENVSLTIAAEVTVAMDDISVNLLLFDVDRFLISENNKEYIAEFQTPICHYLIENQALVIGRWAKELSK
jgi:hypothetical protein